MNGLPWRDPRATWLLVMLFVFVCLEATAQPYPNKPIRWIVPFSTGSGSDTAARLLAPRLSQLLGQPVIIDNRVGAGGVIGTDLAAKAAPDGHTLLWGGVAPLTINVTLQKVSYDPIKDFIPITRIAIAPLVLVAHPSLGVKSLRELLAAAKEHPDRFSYASPGNGTTSQLSMEWIKSRAGVSITHVPYKGTGPGVADLLAGHVHVMFDSIAAVGPHIRSGKLVALAVTGADRDRVLPDIPTVAESGFPGFRTEAWFGVLAPNSTPQHAILRLNQAFKDILENEKIREEFSQLGLNVSPTTPDQFSSFIQTEILKWKKIIEDSRTKLD